MSVIKREPIGKTNYSNTALRKYNKAAPVRFNMAVFLERRQLHIEETESSGTVANVYELSLTEDKFVFLFKSPLLRHRPINIFKALGLEIVSML